MSDEDNLDNIISDGEAEIDKTAASILRFSAKMKKDLKLVKDPVGFGLYYLSISPNNPKYLEKINGMDLDKIDILYAALKRPVMFVDVTNKEVKYLNQNFEGLKIEYNITQKKINGNQAKNLHNLYLKAEKVETKDDLKYAKMYDVSYKIKDKAVKVILANSQNRVEFYLTELSKLGKEGKQIINYLSSLKNEDADYFASVSNIFSIVDTKNNLIYQMESIKDEEGKEIVKMTVHDKKEKGLDFIYNVAEMAKKNPNEKVFSLGQDEEETYHPDSKPPADMYR